MNAANTVVLTGTIVTIGRWAQEKPLDIKVVVGGVFLAVALTIMEQGSPKFASQFGLLIIVAAVFTYGVDIVKKSGLTK